MELTLDELKFVYDLLDRMQVRGAKEQVLPLLDMQSKILAKLDAQMKAKQEPPK